MGSDLFSGITFKLNKGDRVGLIGKNGAGKSTLLKVLSKDIESSAGTMAFDKDIQIGFLRQDIDFVKGRTILEEAYQAFEEIKEIELKLAAINEQLATRTDYESEVYSQLIIDLTDLTERYELLGGYNYQGDTEKILQGLGFQRKDFDKLTDTFSGGWRMRIELAKLLLQNNDILLLDEPLSALDPALRIDMRAELKQMQRELGITFIHVTHSQDEALALATIGVVMNEGRIEQFANPIELFNKPANVFVADFVGGHNIMKLGASTYSLRADKLKLIGTSKKPKNKVPSFKIKDIEFLGSSISVTLVGSDDLTLKAKVMDQDFYKHNFEIEQDVYCDWDENDLHQLRN